MKATHRYAVPFIYAALLLLTSPATAQIIGAGQWVDGKLLVDRTNELPAPKALIDEENRIVKSIPSINKATGFPGPQPRAVFSLRSFWRDDALYAVGFNYGVAEEKEDGTKLGIHTFAKWKDGEWCFLGHYKPDAYPGSLSSTAYFATILFVPLSNLIV
jgi:hypothetical protein